MKFKKSGHIRQKKKKQKKPQQTMYWKSEKFPVNSVAKTFE